MTAATECQLYSLDRHDLVAALTAHPRAAQIAAEVVDERFAR